MVHESRKVCDSSKSGALRGHVRVPPRAATTPPISHSTPLSASEGAISMRTHPCNWVGRPFRHKTTHLLLTTRLQLHWRRRHERVPQRAATTPPVSYSTPLSASKGVMSMRTHPGNWEERPFCHKTTHLPSRHDHNCIGDVATGEFHHAQPRRHLYRTRRP